MRCFDTENKKSQNRRRGFSLMEMLVVIAIIAILCGVVFVAVGAIAKSMRFKQCNDYAKTIFMAAQSNLTAMRNNGELGEFSAEGMDHFAMNEDFQSKVNFPLVEGAAEYVYTSSGFTKSYDLVLPVNSVETHVRDKQVVIEYNPVTGNVYAVFYCQNDENLLSLYRNGGLRNDEDKRRDLEIGYYCGSVLSSKGIDVSGSTTTMEFRNEQEGYVLLTITNPDSMQSAAFESGLDVTLNLIGEISGTQKKVQIMNSAGTDLAECKRGSDRLEITYVLDSLADGKSFANFAAGDDEGKGLSQFKDESAFTGGGKFLPGENLSISAEVTFTGNGVSAPLESASLPRVNPMFNALSKNSGSKYTLLVSNGRNLQNLNALTPSVAAAVAEVRFEKDILWQDTVAYYNKEYGDGGTYTNAKKEAPGRALPYFVPIHNAPLLGTANFSGVSLSSSNVGQCTLINGNGKKVIGLNIDSTKYSAPSDKEYYVSADYTSGGKTVSNKQTVHYNLTGLFAFVNTEVKDLIVVNSKVKGMSFAGSDGTPATGTLAGMAGYYAFFNGCGVYMEEKTLEDTSATNGPKAYNAGGDQNWYGVSGEGCVGGLVGYSSSQHVANGYLTDGDKTELSFLRCFSAVPVSGNMRGVSGSSYGYVNGVGGLVGVTRISNFYGCYASGDVMANGVFTANSASGWPVITLNGTTSMGSGGFVGTSHGSMYSNCFANGDVKANQTAGAGSFLGIMVYDASYTASDVTYQQLSLMESCYTTGKVNGNTGSAFTGGNAGAKLTEQVLSTDKIYTDYYQMIAPYYYEVRKIADSQNRDYMTKIEFPTVPDGYKSGSVTYYYLSKDCYYLDMDADEQVTTNRTTIGAAVNYDILMDLVSSFSVGADWVEDQWDEILTWTTDDGKTFNEAYYTIKIFQMTDYFIALKNGYIAKLEEAFDGLWVDSDQFTGETHSIVTPDAKYNFAMIDGMDYYGDWPSISLTHGLAYYEYYSHDPNTIHVQFDRADTGTLLSNEELRALGSHVIADGYAVVLKEKKTSGSLSVKVGTTTASLSYSNAIGWNYNGKTVYLLLLTRTQLHTNAPARFTAEGYYIPVSYDVPWKIKNQTRSCTIYFNPFTANSQVNPTMIDKEDFTFSTEKPAIPAQIEVRTARQLVGLMDYRCKAFVAEGYNYLQTLDIDASTYLSATPAKGYTSTTDINTIKNLFKNANGLGVGTTTGTSIEKFQGTYTGIGTGDDRPIIANFFDRKFLGLFLNIGDKGVVSNLILEASGLTKDVSTKTNAGAGLLADVNEGTIKNVDVVLDGTVSLKAKTNAGVLVGKSTGTIENCNVTATGGVTIAVTATTADASAGGMVGYLSGKVKGGSVNFSKSLAVNAPNAGGFAGTAANADVEGVTAKVKSLTCAISSAKVGGLVGNMDDGKYTNVNVTVSGTTGSSSHTAMGGMAGYADSVAIVDSSVTVTDQMTAQSVAGLAPTANKINVKNHTVTVKGTLTGTGAAAGMVATTSGSNSFDSCSVVVMDGGTIHANNAAGFAVTLLGGCTKSTVKLDSGTISGSEVAGFAHTINGEIKDNCAVMGKGSITGTSKAAGFVVNLTGSVEASRVTPAIAQTADAYRATSNSDLTVSSSGAAAGFVVAVNAGAKVSNCNVLCTITGTTLSGFADENKGTVEGVIANVTMSSGNAFIRSNAGTVINSYGWYASTGTVTRPSSGKYTGCYFADRDGGETETCVTLVDSNGKWSEITLAALKTAYAQLAKGTDRWFNPGAKEAYSYGMSGSYPYPMLRDHYGDWAGSQASSASVAATAQIRTDPIVESATAPVYTTLGLVDPTRKECIFL